MVRTLSLYFIAISASLCAGFPSQSTPPTDSLDRAGPDDDYTVTNVNWTAKRENSIDPSDLSWIKDWTSVGDSYSAGIGAGNRYGGWGDYFCSRYDQSFPAIINTDPRLGSSDGRTFTYWPCSGAVTDDVTNQVNGLADSSQDVITISSGGNDAFLSAILNECVFQWFSDADPISSQCQSQLDKSQAVIDSPEFSSKLDNLINAAKSKLKPGGGIYYVGYAQFFGQDSTQCNDVTWAFWYEYTKREYLTQDKRTKMNTLVQNMNKALANAVARGGNTVTFVDYDKYYIKTLGRYCEDKYVETSPNRYGLLFYEWNTDDNAPETDGTQAQSATGPFNVSPGLVMNGTFEGDINNYIAQALANNTSWAQNYTTAKGAPPSIDSVNATQDQIARGYSSNLVPDGYGRVFHPRPNGHQLIANLILYYIEDNYADKLHQIWAPEDITSDICPARSAASQASSSTLVAPTAASFSFAPTST